MEIILRNGRNRSTGYFVLPDRQEEVTHRVDDARSQRLLFISLEGPRRLLLFYTSEDSDEIRSHDRTQETRRLRQFAKNGSEDGLHYLVLSMKGASLAAYERLD